MAASADDWENGLDRASRNTMSSKGGKEPVRRESIESITSSKASDVDTRSTESIAPKLFTTLPDEERTAQVRLVFDDVLAEVMQEMGFELHKEEVRKKSFCQACHTKCLAHSSPASNLDIFGLPLGDKNAVTDKFQCYKCNSWYPAQRYAPHLEKCLGFGGRNNSRSSSRRPGLEQASPSPMGADSDTESVTGNGHGSSSPNDRRGLKRKESPLRKSMTKKLRMATASDPSRPSPSPKPPSHPNILEKSPTPILDNHIQSHRPLDASPSRIGNKGFRMFSDKTVPLLEDLIVDIDGDADAVGSDDNDYDD
ncbi:hypothetical protein DFS34DRAFT_129304 [Phlyctochytrium arcticum]|nr:hypothetical protein DFS34DRAFT_129304 [Phlyctochytrium arcticum]